MQGGGTFRAVCRDTIMGESQRDGDDEKYLR